MRRRPKKSPQTAEIIRLLQTTNLSGAEIARMFGITRERVRQIANRAFGPGFLGERWRTAIPARRREKETEDALKRIEELWRRPLPEDLARVLRKHGLRIRTAYGRTLTLRSGTGAVIAFVRPRRITMGKPPRTYRVLTVPESHLLVVLDSDGWYAIPKEVTSGRTKLWFTERTKVLRYLKYRGRLDLVRKALQAGEPGTLRAAG